MQIMTLFTIVKIVEVVKLTPIKDAEFLCRKNLNSLGPRTNGNLQKPKLILICELQS